MGDSPKHYQTTGGSHIPLNSQSLGGTARPMSVTQGSRPPRGQPETMPIRITGLTETMPYAPGYHQDGDSAPPPGPSSPNGWRGSTSAIPSHLSLFHQIHPQTANHTQGTYQGADTTVSLHQRVNGAQLPASEHPSNGVCDQRPSGTFIDYLSLAHSQVQNNLPDAVPRENSGGIFATQSMEEDAAPGQRVRTPIANKLNILDRHDQAIASILRRFRDMMLVATEALPSQAIIEGAALNRMALETQSSALVSPLQPRFSSQNTGFPLTRRSSTPCAIDR